jgi:large subunit ribosomal protein L7/L12
MENLKCPRCGSSDLKQIHPSEYTCSACGTGFTLTQPQTGFVDVVLLQAGKKKTDVILALREVTTKEPTIKLLDLAMAKQLTDAAPCIVVSHVTSEVGERVKAKLEKAGAVIELKPA